MKYNKTLNIVEMDLHDLIDCGFDPEKFDAILAYNEIEDSRARIPAMVTVNYSHGTHILEGDEEEVEKALLELDRLSKDYQEYMVRITSPGNISAAALYDKELLETIADLEHSQWIHWSKGLALSETSLNPERLERWKGLWRQHFKELPEHLKEDDLVWARKTIETVVEFITKRTKDEFKTFRR